MLLLLCVALSASSPQNSSVVSGVTFPFPCPHQQHVFSVGKEKEMREAGLGVGEVTHLRLVLNPFSAADFLCVCKSRSNQGPWHL